MKYHLFIVVLSFIFIPTLSEGRISDTILDNLNPSKEKSKTDSTAKSKMNAFKNEPLPVIFFAVHDGDEAFDEVKKWGGTHVHRYGMGKSIKNDQSFFDRAEKHGLKVMSDLRGRYWLKEDEPKISFNEYISHFEKHPALGFWYLLDEPDNKGYTPGEINPYYELIKKETSDIPVALSHAWTKNWYKFGNVQDIYMYNFYPVLGGSFPETRLEEWTRFTKGVIREAGKDNDLVIPVLQIFNWRFFAGEDQKEYRNYPVNKLRYPNSEEFRYMAFSSLALGARGLSLFSYATSKRINSDWGDQVLSPIIKEAKEFAKHIDLSKRNEYSTEEENLFLASWSNDKDDFILLVNATSDSRQLKLNTEIDEIEEFKPWGQTRKNLDLSVAEEEYTIDEMKPWEIMILKK